MTYPEGPRPDENQQPSYPTPAPREPQGTLQIFEQRHLSNDGMREFSRLVPAGVDPEKVLYAIGAAIRESNDLMACSADSISVAVQDCGRLGLYPGPAGHVYLIPYAGKCTTQVGYQGLIALMKRGAGVSHVETGVIREGEEYTFRRGTDPIFEHYPGLDDDAEPIAFFAVAYYASGAAPSCEVMTVGEVDKIRRNHGNARVWDAHPIEMARKTVVRRLAKWVGTDDTLGHAFSILDRDSGPRDVTPQAEPNTNHEAIRARMRGNR